MKKLLTILPYVVGMLAGIWVLASAVTVHPRIEAPYMVFLQCLAAMVLTLSITLLCLALKMKKWGRASFGALVTIPFFVLQILMIQNSRASTGVMSPGFETKFLETCSAWEKVQTPEEKEQVANRILECFKTENKLPGHRIDIPFEKIKEIMGSETFFDSDFSFAYLISRDGNTGNTLSFHATRRYHRMTQVVIEHFIE